MAAHRGTPQDPERVVAAALRAQASISGRPDPGGPDPGGPDPGGSAADWDPPEPARRGIGPGWVLLIALLFGALLGVALGLVSLLAPGVLPPIG